MFIVFKIFSVFLCTDIIIKSSVLFQSIGLRVCVGVCLFFFGGGGGDDSRLERHITQSWPCSQAPVWSPQCWSSPWWMRGLSRRGFKLQEGRFWLSACNKQQLRLPSLLWVSVWPGDSMDLLADFNAHVGNNRVTWMGVIRRMASLIWTCGVLFWTSVPVMDRPSMS